LKILFDFVGKSCFFKWGGERKTFVKEMERRAERRGERRGEREGERSKDRKIGGEGGEREKVDVGSRLV
jgi:hypothetical protein